MSVLGECVGLVIQGLDKPPRSIIDEAEATLFVYQALSLYLQQLAAADHLIVGFYFDPQIPVTRDLSLASEAGFSMASFVQRKVNDYDQWEKVEIVDIDQLDTYEASGQFAIAFYGSGVSAAARLSWDPATVQYSQLRIWHSPNAIYAGTLADEMTFPPNFTQMVAAKAIMLAFPKLARRAVKAKDEGYATYLTAWRETNGPFLEQFEEQFLFFRTETRDSGSGQNLAFGAGRRGGTARRL